MPLKRNKHMLHPYILLQWNTNIQDMKAKPILDKLSPWESITVLIDPRYSMAVFRENISILFDKGLDTVKINIFWEMDVSVSLAKICIT